MSQSKRLLLLKIFWVLCFLVSVVLPALSVMSLMLSHLNEWTHANGAGLLFFGLFCFTILPGMIYWTVLFDRFMPKTFWRCALFLVPFFLSLAFSLKSGEWQTTWDGFVLHSSAGFLGLYSTYFVGLIGLSFKHSFISTDRYDLQSGAIVLFVFLALILTLLLVAFFAVGYAKTYSYWGLAGYFLQVIASFSIFYPRLQLLYGEKRL